MDLYPEALVAAGWLSTRHPIYHLLARWRRAALPNAVLCLGPGQLAFLRARTGYQGPAFLLPAGIPTHLDNLVPDSRAVGPPLLVYVGNLGRMHRPDVLAEIIERGAARGCRFLLAVHGHHAAAFRRRLEPLTQREHPAVMWRDRLSECDLVSATAHLVTLAGPATHVCVPSKAVSAVCLGRPIIFAGSPESDVWTGLGGAGWLIPEQPNGDYRPQDIETALDGVLDPDAVAVRATAAQALSASLRAQWHQTVVDLAAWIGRGVKIGKGASPASGGQGSQRSTEGNLSHTLPPYSDCSLNQVEIIENFP